MSEKKQSQDEKHRSTKPKGGKQAKKSKQIDNQKKRRINLRGFGVTMLPLKRRSLTFRALAPDTLAHALQELPIQMKRSV